jgi:hypothetical protein
MLKQPKFFAICAFLSCSTSLSFAFIYHFLYLALQITHFSTSYVFVRFQYL